MQRITVFMLTTLALLGGCKVGPDYQKPALNVSDHFIASSKRTDTLAAIEQDWWRHFNDPILDDLIARALAGNFDIKIASAHLAEARAMRASARSDLNPTVNVTGSAVREANQFAFGNVPFDISKPFNNFQAGFDASWELDLFGGKRRTLESATAELGGAEAARDEIRVSTLAEVARIYVDIRHYQAQFALAQEVVASQRHTLAIVKERFAVGETAGLTVTEAQVQLAQSEAQLPYYQDLLKERDYEMDVLLGQQPGATLTLLATVKPIPIEDGKWVLAVPAEVIANRPDIYMAEHKLAAATADQGVATAQLFPDISLSGFLGLLNTDAGTLLMANSKSWALGGNILWPILNYGKISAGISMADARQQQALLQYQKAVIAALSDVERAATALTEEEAQRALLAKTVDDNRHGIDIAQTRYKQGLSSFAEVLEAERVLYASQSKLAEANAMAAQNLIAVYKSLGGSWSGAPASITAPAKPS